ncbi:VOC family protein [Paenibacillus lutrae]|uniref:Glyoxalase/bleomycin resistance/extradiol dioxygenase family protein n=1 Tax=Paenibacillus lutrae TaxID=2078573 RepID=A0A7X3FLC7_9BACL|nr:VOC family protein [Paenibacillus lutrae]MVP01843.1 glyoxalase/bleomycin resistance/extradiol dioxygenase family protein [Paenibacillus lutrae]
MALQADKIFVNLPVKDLNKTVEFFTQIGFEFNPQFTDENATCMVISEHIFVMLLVEDFFKTFTKKQITDTAVSTEVIVALSADSREQVDEIVSKALAAGAAAYNDKVDHGFMYSWSFQDINGHLWELVYMDESTVNQG